MAQVNKQAIAAAFGRAASHYEQHAGLQCQSADALLALLGERDYARVLDAGCGPGRMSRYWREQGSEVSALDLSEQMLAEAQRQNTAHHYLLADIEAILKTLPLLTWPGAIWRCSGAAIYTAR